MTEPYQAPAPGWAPDLDRAPEPGHAPELYRAPEPGQAPAPYPPQNLYRAAEPSEASGAGRAATVLEEEAVDADITSFPGAIGWTIAGTILPGLGFLRARRWGEGIVTLICFVGLVAGVGYLVYERTFVVRLMTSPVTLLGIAVLCGMLGVLITGIVLATYLALRPQVLATGQRIAGAVLVLVLCFVVCLPLAVGAGYSLSQAGIVR